MTQFEIMAAQEIVCDICGGRMVALYGGGWDNDRMMCVEPGCHAEIEFPTSTQCEEDES